MSLVGSIEDLGLSDILQIISLSRKSGVLYLTQKEKHARILFKLGLVVGAEVQTSGSEFKRMLIEQGVIEEAAAESIEGDMTASGMNLESLVLEKYGAD